MVFFWKVMRDIQFKSSSCLHVSSSTEAGVWSVQGGFVGEGVRLLREWLLETWRGNLLGNSKTERKE